MAVRPFLISGALAEFPYLVARCLAERDGLLSWRDAGHCDVLAIMRMSVIALVTHPERWHEIAMRMLVRLASDQSNPEYDTLTFVSFYRTWRDLLVHPPPFLAHWDTLRILHGKFFGFDSPRDFLEENFRRGICEEFDASMMGHFHFLSCASWREWSGFEETFSKLTRLSCTNEHELSCQPVANAQLWEYYFAPSEFGTRFLKACSGKPCVIEEHEYMSDRSA